MNDLDAWSLFSYIKKLVYGSQISWIFFLQQSWVIFFRPRCLACRLHYAWLAQATCAIDKFVDLKLTQ